MSDGCLCCIAPGLCVACEEFSGVQRNRNEYVLRGKPLPSLHGNDVYLGIGVQTVNEILAGVAIFASTNIDDIFVLLLFFADRRFTTSQVITGQYLGFGLLVVISIFGSLVSLVIPSQWLGLLGIFPLALGIKKLADLRNNEQDVEAAPMKSSRFNILAVATVTFANGGDNLGVYIPLFAIRPLGQVFNLVMIFLLLVGVWCAVARFMLNHRHLGFYLKRFGHLLLPFVLMALGIWILLPLVWPRVGL